jgi:tripartite-type tricarboxylate transporter receptor subunit TctC
MPSSIRHGTLNKQSAEVIRIVKSPEIIQRFRQDGAEVVGSTPREFTVYLKAEMQNWRKVIKDAGIQPD